MIYKNKTEFIKENIKSTDIVLDVGFWGQAIKITDDNWVHKILKDKAKEVYGLDLDYDETMFKDNYLKANAEDFDFDVKFDVIFASDLIEHLSNPGLFLNACKRNLKPNGRIIVTTPNTYNLFNLFSKVSRGEPQVNHDHTCYFNEPTLKQLCGKNNLEVEKFDYMYSLDVDFKESWKKKIINIPYYLLSKFTDKYIESLVAIIKLK